MGSEFLEKLVAEVVGLRRRVIALETLELTLPGVLVAADYVTRGSDLTATTSFADYLSVTPTLPAGRVEVVAVVPYYVPTTAGYDFEAKLFVDGTERHFVSAALLAQYQQDELTLIWSGELSAGARNIKVQIRKSNSAPTVSALAKGRLMYHHYSWGGI